jgi:MFS family permease
LLAAFVLLEQHVANPMLDLSLFYSRLFSASAASAVLNYICVYTVLFLLPFYLIQGRGLGTQQAGLILTVQPVVMAIAAPISGTLSDRIGSRLPGTMGMAILAAGLYMLSRASPDSSVTDIALALATVGLGTGIFVSPNNSALMGSAPGHRQGIASGILATSRNVGMVLGVGVAGAIFTTILASNSVSAPTSMLIQAVDTGFLVSVGFALLGTLTCAVRGS